MQNYKHTIHILEELMDEITSSGNVGKQELEVLGMVLDEIKDAETICAMRESSEYSNGMSYGYSGGRSYGGGGYSGRYIGDYSGMYSGNRYSNGMEHDGMYSGYDDMNSHRRYRNPSTGRFTSRRPNGYSRDDSNERIMGQLERLMGETDSEQVRTALRDAMERMN